MGAENVGLTGNLTAIPSITGTLSEVKTMTASLSAVPSLRGTIRPYDKADVYHGVYDVTSLPYYDQELETAGKILIDDICIRKIPYYEVTNPEGGITITIGG